MPGKRDRKGTDTHDHGYGVPPREHSGPSRTGSPAARDWRRSCAAVPQAGDLLVKPRREWHTFFNVDDEPASMPELISPGGITELFRSFGR
jgi:hypothetical protein